MTAPTCPSGFCQWPFVVLATPQRCPRWHPSFRLARASPDPVTGYERGEGRVTGAPELLGQVSLCPTRLPGLLRWNLLLRERIS